MIPSLAVALLAGQNPFAPQNPPPVADAVPARLVGASLFKNGFAITQRSVEIAKPGSTVVLPIPQGALGTIWFTPTEGLNLDSVVVENETVSTSAKAPASSVDEILNLNVGSAVTLLLAEPSGPPSRLIGKLVAATGSIVVIETAETTRVLPKASVVGVEGKELKSQSNFTSGFTRRVMRIRTTGKPGHVSVVALERGLSWIPAYAVNLLPDGKSLTLVAKATVVNDLEKLTELDCRFVSGFPNLPFKDTIDPLVQWMMNAPGGFGGGGLGGAPGAAFMNQESRRGANVGFKAEDAAAFADGGSAEGEYLGELFFYRRPGISLDVNGRGAYALFGLTVPYETVYAWDLSDPSPGQPTFTARIPPPGAPSTDEVWQTLRFVNTGKAPLTTAPATTFSESQIVGQDTLKYVSPGQTAELRVTRSLDLSPDFTEEEIGRERGFVKGKTKTGEYPIYDRITAKGTITIVNRKTKAVKMRIRKPFTGVWGSAEGSPKVTTTAAGLRLPNPTGLAEWLVTVEPGATMKLTYTVKLLVSS